jgi:GntR family transcriptional regulator, vanillate catabolism transcriptional regulator
MPKNRMVWHDYQIIHRSHDDHHRIVEAIAHQQAKRAESLMQEHVFFAGQVLKKHIETDTRIAEEPGERG